MKTRLILITFRRLRINCRAHFCGDCGNDHHRYCEERNCCFIYCVIHTNTFSSWNAIYFAGQFAGLRDSRDGVFYPYAGQEMDRPDKELSCLGTRGFKKELTADPLRGIS
jgi:hypothetical protein